MCIYICVCICTHIWLTIYFSKIIYLILTQLLYQPCTLRAMDMIREHSFIVSNAQVLLTFALLKKEKVNSYLALNHTSLGANRKGRKST